MRVPAFEYMQTDLSSQIIKRYDPDPLSRNSLSLALRFERLDPEGMKILLLILDSVSIVPKMLLFIAEYTVHVEPPVRRYESPASFQLT
jgi:hypothetical protein